MKKTVALLLCFALCFLFTACGKKDDGTATAGSAVVEKYAANGTMPDCEFSLGDNRQSVLDVLSTLEGDHTDSDGGDERPAYTEYEADGYNVLSTAENNYYFSLEDDTLKVIVAFGDAFGFEHGTVISEVKSAMEKSGFSASAETAAAEDIFFLYGSVAREKLEYKFSSNTVVFVFEENALCATALYGA